jgi:hypothetical protein
VFIEKNPTLIWKVHSKKISPSVLSFKNRKRLEPYSLCFSLFEKSSSPPAYKYINRKKGTMNPTLSLFLQIKKIRSITSKKNVQVQSPKAIYEKQVNEPYSHI